MSAIAAKILGKHHEHVYREVGHRHRLSYADLDALLDREEKQLAADHQRQRAQRTTAATTTAAVDTNNPLVGDHDRDHDHPKRRSSSSIESSASSSSSGSEDEADWHAGGEHEEDLLLELEETTQESILTVTGAEDHLVHDIDHIVYVRACGRVCAVLLTMSVRACVRSHVDITDEQLERMKRLLHVNCLHRGDIERVRGKRWMVAFDGSEASKRAYEGVLRLMDPALDHLLVVTVCDKNLPRRFALCPSEETQLRFELWKAARHILKPYIDELPNRLVRAPCTHDTPPPHTRAVMRITDILPRHAQKTHTGAEPVHRDGTERVGRQAHAVQPVQAIQHRHAVRGQARQGRAQPPSPPPPLAPLLHPEARWVPRHRLLIRRIPTNTLACAQAHTTCYLINIY
jgi:hypothetical protein